MLELDSQTVRRVKPHAGQRVLLLPGQWYFGQTGAMVRTLLGSCIAVTLWHPGRQLGGMCHFLLPTRPRPPDGTLDGRFGDEAMELLARAVARAGTRPSDFEVNLFGGADTMPDEAKVKFNIGERNVEKAWELIDRYGFQLVNVDVGGTDPRTVVIDLCTGQVELHRGRGR